MINNNNLVPRSYLDKMDLTKIKDDFSVSDIYRYDKTRYKIHTYRRSNQPAREDSQAISLSTLSNCPEQNLFTRGKKNIV